MSITSYVIRLLSAALIGYLLGSISNSVLISKLLFHRDVRDAGSGNAGATNMARVFGMGPGVAALVLDAAKTALSLYLGKVLAGEWGMCLAGIFCNIGHCWPVFFRFSGGKGVSVGVATAAFLGWPVFLTAAAVFFLLFACTRIVSVSSMAAAVSLPIMCLILHAPAPNTLLAIAVLLLILLRHRSNIIRLQKGEEQEFHPADEAK